MSLDRLYYARRELSPLWTRTLVEGGWQRTTNRRHWDLYFPTSGLRFQNELRSVAPTRPEQRIMGVSGTRSLWNKRLLWMQLVQTLGVDAAADIVPPTYLLKHAGSREQLRMDFNEQDSYLLKDPTKSCRRGLELSKSLPRILSAPERGYTIAQRMIPDVYTVLGRKLHMRLFVLIQRGPDGWSAYLHSHGKCIYAKRRDQGAVDFGSAITFSTAEVPEGAPYTIAELGRYLDDRGHDSRVFFADVRSILRRAIEAAGERIRRNPILAFHHCFQVFGADIIFDEKFKPYLVEINRSPDMRPKCPKDEVIKARVLGDALRKADLFPEGPRKNGYALICRQGSQRADLVSTSEGSAESPRRSGAGEKAWWRPGWWSAEAAKSGVDVG